MARWRVASLAPCLGPLRNSVPGTLFDDDHGKAPFRDHRMANSGVISASVSGSIILKASTPCWLSCCRCRPPKTVLRRMVSSGGNSTKRLNRPHFSCIRSSYDPPDTTTRSRYTSHHTHGLSFCRKSRCVDF